MTRITSSFPKTRIPQIETRKVEFAYESDDYTNFCITAEVEISGEGANRSYVCAHHDAERGDGGELSDAMYRRVAERAEEIVWEMEEAPKNPRTGCDCLPTVDPVQNAQHERDCPLRLKGEERRVFEEQKWKDTRELADPLNTEIYLTLK